MGAQNFYFAAKFPKIGICYFLASNYVFLDENFLIWRIYSDRL